VVFDVYKRFCEGVVFMVPDDLEARDDDVMVGKNVGDGRLQVRARLHGRRNDRCTDNK